MHLAQARGGLLVGSVIAVDEGTASGDVLGVAEEIVTAEARKRGSVPRLSLFDLPLGDASPWSISEEPATSVKTPDGREERVVSILPAWRATTALDLSDLGGAAVVVAQALQLGHFVCQARQVCTARYSTIGFEAAAVTALAVAVSAGRPGVRRIATVRFGHPYAVVAVAFDGARMPQGSGPSSAWHGLPVFSAWVVDPCDAE